MNSTQCNISVAEQEKNFSLCFQYILDQKRNHQILSPSVRSALVSFYLFVIIGGFAINSTILYLILRHAKLRTRHNSFIANQAVADLFLCLVCLPFSLMRTLNDQWLWGFMLCKIIPFLQGSSTTMSIVTTMRISIYRYMNVVTNRTVLYSVWGDIFLVWFFAALPISPLTAVQSVIPVGEEHYGFVVYEVCTESWPVKWGKSAYTLVILTLHYIVPLSVITTLHFKIVNYLNIKKTKRRHVARIVRQSKRNRKTTALLVTVTVLFMFSWLPYHIVRVLYDYTDVFVGHTALLYALAGFFYLLAMCSTIINPIVYGFMNRSIREAYIKLLKRLCIGQRVSSAIRLYRNTVHLNQAVTYV